jgi:hypothetical protein
MAMNTEQIRAKLATLDPKDDEQWTGDGLPDLSLFPGVKRAEVTAAAPRFSRKTLEESPEAAFDAVVETGNKVPEPPKPADEERPGTSDAYIAWCEKRGFTPDGSRLDQMRRMEVIERQSKARAEQMLSEQAAVREAASKFPGARKSPIDAAYAARRPTDRPPPPNPVK